MSVIYITDHNENIYDMIKPPSQVYKKPARYKSNLITKYKLDNINKEQYATMGLERVPPPDPSMFLRKHSTKITQKGETLDRAGRECTKEKKRPPIPSFKGIIQTDKGNEKKPKNFIRANINDICKRKAAEAQPKFVDTRNGNVKEVKKSGLEPHYVFKKSFGKAPNYLLKRVNKDDAIQAESQKDSVAKISTFTNCQYIKSEERQELLNGLKGNWRDLHKEYLRLPLLTDTVPKILRKTRLEKQLKELEKDISFIEKYEHIYVYNGSS